VKELGTDGLPFATVHRVFEALLRERAWPRDSVATLEALVDASATTRDPRELIEAVRRKIVPHLLRRRGIAQLEPIVLEPEFEGDLHGWLVEGTIAPSAELALHVRASIEEYARRVPRERAALVCTAGLRPAMAEFLRRFGLGVDVYAFGELPPELDIRPASVLERPRPVAIPA
jgi:flagellar biosynthesis component FlhA